MCVGDSPGNTPSDASEVLGDPAVVDMTMENPPPTSVVPLRTFGTLSCGYETMSAAWPGLEHVFSYDGDAHSRAAFSSSDTRPPRKLLRERPVDLLVVDLGARQPGRARFRESWLDLVQEATERPLVIMESWPPEAASWENHPMSKGMAQPWADLGYSSRFRLVSSLWVGGGGHSESSARRSGPYGPN